MSVNARRAFTLIELLIVISIIGLIATIAVTATNSARMKARDAKRLSDLKQLQSALGVSYEPGPGFPAVAAPITLGDATHRVLCNIGAAPTFQTSLVAPGACGTVFMGLVPSNPTPGGSGYSYRSTTSAGAVCAAGPCPSYCIQATLEQANTQNGLTAGSIAVEPTLIRNGVCP
ncbi:MAG: type II secretion system protein [Patescibacteria group bacterium]|jgi:prepilin-type N-terminal cleavage/methylation domain-containing protein